MENLSATYYNKKGVQQAMEIPLLEIFRPFEASIGDDSPENIMALEAKMAKPIFKVSDTGISSKNLLGWKSSGVLLEFSKHETGWTKLNFTELIWLYAVKELRDMGIGLAQIRKIKDELIYPTGFYKDALRQHSVAAYKKDKENLEIPIEKLKSISNLLVFLTTARMFTNVLQESIIRRVNMQLIVLKNGDAYYYEEGEQELFKQYAYNDKDRYEPNSTLNIEELRFQSHITISLTELIRNYVLNSKDALTISALGLMTLEERELFELIRRKNIRRITIRYHNEKINLVEVLDNLTIVDIESRYCDHVLKNGYQKIEYETENGKLVTFNRTTKLKY